MKITKRQLKRIIREEYARLHEARKPSRNAVTKKLVSVAEQVSEINEYTGDNINIGVIDDELFGGTGHFETFHIMKSMKGASQDKHREVQQLAYKLIKDDDPGHPILQNPDYQPLQIEKPKKSRIHPAIRQSRAAPGWRD